MRKYKLLHDFLNTCVKVTQSQGGVVERNGVYGVTQDINAAPAINQDSVCLLGAVETVLGLNAKDALGLTYTEQHALEAGFCGWRYGTDNWYPRPPHLRALYDLGDKIARELRDDDE